MKSLLHVVRVVFLKELSDILRDRRALMTVGMLAVFSGPVLLLMLAGMMAKFEAHAERRIMLVDGIEHAPSLQNYLERETIRLERPPQDYAEALRLGRLPDPVIIIPEDFERIRTEGGVPVVVILTDSTNGRADAGVARVQRWLSGYSAQQSSMRLAMRGVSTNGLASIEVDRQDLSAPSAQAILIFGMLPFFFVLAALYGVWGPAMDTTAGERERGTLQPLLMTPADGYVLVLGKWLAVSLVGGLVGSMTVLGFLPAQRLMPGEALRSMMTFGWHEVLLPLTGLMAALMMLAGARARSSRQAQASATVLLLLVTMVPLAMKMDGGGVVDWHLYVPVVAQHTLWLAMFAGDHIPFLRLLSPALVALLLVAPLLWLSSRLLRRRI
jgi:sodium transport system permease protein